MQYKKEKELRLTYDRNLWQVIYIREVSYAHHVNMCARVDGWRFIFAKCTRVTCKEHFSLSYVTTSILAMVRIEHSIYAISGWKINDTSPGICARLLLFLMTVLKLWNTVDKRVPVFSFSVDFYFAFSIRPEVKAFRSVDEGGARTRTIIMEMYFFLTVSYTHLTLPTIYSV